VREAVAAQAAMQAMLKMVKLDINELKDAYKRG
jgi:predicted 3-demethylubiquinone-9 3-methyltransferase (glyoxalase superfamily)